MLNNQDDFFRYLYVHGVDNTILKPLPTTYYPSPIFGYKLRRDYEDVLKSFIESSNMVKIEPKSPETLSSLFSKAVSKEVDVVFIKPRRIGYRALSKELIEEIFKTVQIGKEREG